MNFKFSHLALIAALCVLGLSGCASGILTPEAAGPATAGTTFYVSGAGNDTSDGLSTGTAFRTLQRAANVVGPGMTVLVMNGTYSNSIASSPVVTISVSGTPNNWIKFNGYPGATPVISFTGYNGVQFDSAASYVELKGLTIIGNNQNVTLAQALQYASQAAKYPEFNGNCVGIVGGSGVTTAGPHHINILNNVIHDCGGAGVATVSADYITISGNTIYNTSWYTAYGTSAISNLTDWDSNPADVATPYKMIITNNLLYNNQEYVPWQQNQPAPAITDGEAIIIDTNQNNRTGNSQIAYTGRTLIANNVIYNDGSAAVEAFHSSHIDVVNNSTYGNVLSPAESGRGEVNINFVDDVNVINNVMYSSVGQNPIVVSNGCTTHCTIDYNVYYGGSTKLSGAVSGPHDLVVNPLFATPIATTPTGVSLKLLPGSPALGSGTSYLAPTTDINGTPRPSSAGYTRGAYSQ